MEMQNKTANKREAMRSFWKNHRIISILGVLFIALVAYRAGHFFLVPDVKIAEPAINVKVTAAKYEPIDLISPITGRLKPTEEVALVPLATGKVTAVHVSVGDRVTAGQVLFEIDKGQVSATYNQAKESFDAVASTFARMELLYREGAVSLQDYESAKSQYAAARESLNMAADMYGNFTITSPIDGYVTALNVSVGSIAGGTAAGSVANVEELIIETSVSEILAQSVEVGETVQVYIDSLGKEYTGTVTAFSPVPSMGMLTYPLTITMLPDEALFAGMFAEVRLVSERVQEALCIPSESVIIRDGRTVVAVLDREDVPELKEVIPGIDNGIVVQIISGLEEGDRVIWTGQHFVVSGIEVNVVEETP
ncbi:MAG: efflux RND transporter periplasmic adaptor subunit [Eubacteriales bacterium]|jgi:RND family efflux transporter MFP subunit|nr:efflux RND transporter periplasmic adaptor subunit [Eubacteriales bacterium]MDD3537797.1 efflux RND transporter periplasmic adaptor subunit [Eubacteriales bacterium]MDD4286010.1 efflux RND transporter periplasmic adaptor subunit [Eubacteriales bacterium]HPF18720.1 efflux RND transporter periplasmic adaptor subunit [Bacillota bacterium]